VFLWYLLGGALELKSDQEKNMTFKSQTIEESVQVLSKVLANTAILQMKTKNGHWNVQDPRFSQLHSLFDCQSDELLEGIDEVAERIRMLDARPLATFAEFLKVSSLQEDMTVTSGHGILEALLKDHQKMVGFLRQALERLKDSEDQGTLDLLTDRLRSHEKTAWILASHHV
jgi:starvation-inducible DNA-binding protein